MNNVEMMIRRIEREIEELGRDIHYVNNESSVSVLKYGIDRRKERLQELKSKLDEQK